MTNNELYENCVQCEQEISYIYIIDVGTFFTVQMNWKVVIMLSDYDNDVHS